MLTRLRVSNFKTWEDAELNLAPVTVLFGANSSGKTSLIQFLLMLKQTRQATDRALALDLGGPLVDLGTFNDVVHKHESQRHFNWQLCWKTSSPLTIHDPREHSKSVLFKSSDFAIASEVAAESGEMRTRELSYEFGGNRFTLHPKDGDKNDFELVFEPSAMLSGNAGEFRFIRTVGRQWQLPGPVKSYAFPDQVRIRFQNAGILGELEAAYEAQMDSVNYLGPLRVYPQRDYQWGRARPNDVGERGERTIEAILAATTAGELRNMRRKGKLRPFQEIVAAWLRELGLIESFRVEEIKVGSNRWQAKVQVGSDAPEVLLTDVGFGVSQILPVVTLLNYVPEGSTVVLEQPEIHLHPLAQANLADLVISIAMNRKVQVIVESHSEHFLLRLQRRIAEDAFSAESAALYFCRSVHGTSSLERLEVDLFGNISNWPEKFFGDAFGETAAAEKARAQRARIKK
jgi:predicted ATPase